MKKRATIKNIADSLNLSVSTVSRILNDKGEFSEQTKNAVLQVADMLDYRANSLAVSLRKNIPRKVIGVILPQVNHYFFSSILNGIMVSSHNSGYMVMVGESLDSYELEKELINNFSDHFVGGIIISPSKDKASAQNIVKMNSEATPHTVIDRTFEGRAGSFVKHDDFNGAYKAVETLIKSGCKKIALIKGPKTCTISSSRTEGYQKALQAHGLKASPYLIKSASKIDTEHGYECFKEIYEREKPDAVFTITDILASGVYEYAFENNLSIPQDLSVIGYSNSEICHLLRPKLTSVNQNGFEMGTKALEYVLEQISNPDVRRQMTFESNLIYRESVKAL